MDVLDFIFFIMDSHGNGWRLQEDFGRHIVPEFLRHRLSVDRSLRLRHPQLASPSSGHFCYWNILHQLLVVSRRWAKVEGLGTFNISDRAADR